mmetsp:Transcript_18923/g.62467  ORF Transcript_18923/g.62467 Transcript_18923/m.62467 type:complete len:241 (+) Transcript_18923:654-1376(+)
MCAPCSTPWQRNASKCRRRAWRGSTSAASTSLRAPATSSPVPLPASCASSTARRWSSVQRCQSRPAAGCFSSQLALRGGRRSCIAAAAMANSGWWPASTSSGQWRERSPCLARSAGSRPRPTAPSCSRARRSATSTSWTRWSCGRGMGILAGHGCRATLSQSGASLSATRRRPLPRARRTACSACGSCHTTRCGRTSRPQTTRPRTRLASSSREVTSSRAGPMAACGATRRTVSYSGSCR